MTEDRMIKNVPRTYQARGKNFTGHLKDNTGVSRNAKGEMVVDGKTLPDSKHHSLRKQYDMEIQT